MLSHVKLESRPSNETLRVCSQNPTRKDLETDIMKRKSLIVCLHKDFAARQTEAYQLERTEQEKEELLQKLQLQCEESKHENVRLAERNKKSEDLISQHRSEIWELKLKQRKMKLKFENELHSMMQQHKQLYAAIVSRHLLPPPPHHSRRLASGHLIQKDAQPKE
ncbi:uncharacterized protein ACBT44_001164 isoform 3-T6 [Syngnathus typhle]